MYSLYTYRDAQRDFTADEINAWPCGFAIELSTTAEHATFEAFVKCASASRIDEITRDDGIRDVSFATMDGTLRIVHDPRAERVLAREWNGVDDRCLWFDVMTRADADPQFVPRDLYGREAWDAFRAMAIPGEMP